MEIKNETQHKVLVNRLVERSYELQATCYRLIFILLSITIGSCYSIESDCDDGGGFYWERTSIYGSGNNTARSMTIASNGDIWIGSTNSSEVFLSTDNGDTWVQKYNGYNNLSQIRSIAVSPINGYIFAGTSRNGLLRSTDNGETWVQVLNNIDYVHYIVLDILITPIEEIYLVIVYLDYSQPPDTEERVYYSSDNGNTWIGKSNGLPEYHYDALALGRDGTLYIATGRGVYRSIDGGDNWLPPSNYNNGISVTDVTISDDGSVFASTYKYVLKSIDKGITWTEINNGLGDEYFFYGIIYNPINKDIFLTEEPSYSKVYRSTNFGTSWELKNNGIPEGNRIQVFAFNPNTGQMYVAISGGVYRSKNYP